MQHHSDYVTFFFTVLLFLPALLFRLHTSAARCLHTVQHHSDYVTCLAASEAAGKLVSAGLRSEVITYDMQVGGVELRSAAAAAAGKWR
jgi:hypothetical protein